jgi:hypothetical protein
LADYAWNLINLYSVSVTSLTAFVNVYGDKNDCALCEVTRVGVDTVGVWGSNPHAPTNIIQQIHKFSPSAQFLFKRSVIGSYHKLSVKHLDRYLHEFEFRFNNRHNAFLFRDTIPICFSSEIFAVKLAHKISIANRKTIVRIEPGSMSRNEESARVKIAYFSQRTRLRHQSTRNKRIAW